MAGLSQRFINAGYIVPKYMLYAKNRSLFNIAISSFSRYFNNYSFLFIARNIFDTETFINKECDLLGIKEYKIAILEKTTRGQAETVYEGIIQAKIPHDESITIFNIDTFISDYQFPSSINDWDGFLEVFKGKGSNWSYARTENEFSTKVIETAEKKEISEFCSTGLYYFQTTDLFNKAYIETYLNRIEKTFNEFYVAPLYNILIQYRLNIHINVIDREKLQFCGIPEEYYSYLKQIIS